MKRVILIFLIFISFNLSSNEFSNTFSFGLSGGTNLLFFDTTGYLSRYYNDRSVLTVIFFEQGFKFDYIFLKKINLSYLTGFSLGVWEILYFGGIDPDLRNVNIYTLFFYGGRYYVFNRLSAKIAYSNVIEWNIKKRLLIEGGITLSFITFFNIVGHYYNTMFIGPYLFVGFWTISKYKDVSNIIGGFMELNFDVGKYFAEYTGEYEGVEKPNFFSFMQFVYCYFSFGVEYRVGKRVER